MSTNIKRGEQRFSPYTYYKKLRPEFFSDTIVKYEVPLTQELFDLQLELLSTKKKQSAFENFIVAVAKRVVTPNIKPQTGPDGGGDGKVDAETYEVSDDISDKWYTAENTANGKEYWAIAISCKKKWKEKVKSDIEKIVATGRGYTKALFFTNQYVKSSTRVDVEADLSKQYGIEVKIYDANAISKWVFQDGCLDIALFTLEFSDTYKQKNVFVGPNDKKRKDSLADIEKNILRHVEGLDTQYVDELYDTCILSRSLEYPKTEIEGRFFRAMRECEKHGTSQQLFNINYEYAWTCFFWFEDYRATYETYLILKNSIEEQCNVTRVEKLTNTLTNLINAAKAEVFDSELITKEINYIKDLQKKLDKNNDKQSSALYLAIYIQEQKLIDRLIEGKLIDDELRSIKPLLVESASHIDISFESHFKIMEILSKFIEENEIFEQLVDELAEIIAEKRSKSEAAKVRFSRAEDHIEKGRWLAAIKQLGFCVYAFEQEDCMTELIRSSALMGIAFENLGLLYSAEAYLVKATSFLIQDFYQSGVVPHFLVSVLQELCGIELKLGRIVMYLNWYELLSVISTNAQFNEEEAYKAYFEQDDVSWACRFSVSDLKNPSVAKLPDVLNRMGLFKSSEYLKYALGYSEVLDENVLSIIKEIDNSSKLQEHSVHEQFLDKLNVSTTGIAYAKTTANNFTITISYVNHPKVQRIAELFLASVESFMATSELFEIVPINNQIVINIVCTDEESDLICGKESNCYELKLNLATYVENVWWKCFVSFIGYVLMKNSLTRESIDLMIEKKQNGERLMDRISVLQRTERALNNVLGQEYKYRIEDWCRDSDKLYTYKGETNSFEEKDYRNRQQSTIDIFNINSDMKYWDVAKWIGCSFMFDGTYQCPLVFGLAFRNIDAGQKIVEEWKEKYKVTIYIVKGINSQHPTWYRVCVAPTVPCEMRSKGRYFSAICRKHTMTPQTNENLARFESQYQQFGGCRLMAFAINDDNTLNIPISTDNAYDYHDIEIREAYQINSTDPAQIALEPDDMPYVPEDYKDDVPVLQVLDSLKDCISKIRK